VWRLWHEMSHGSPVSKQLAFTNERHWADLAAPVPWTAWVYIRNQASGSAQSFSSVDGVPRSLSFYPTHRPDQDSFVVAFDRNVQITNFVRLALFNM
jgi:hypothetical protein